MNTSIPLAAVVPDFVYCSAYVLLILLVGFAIVCTVLTARRRPFYAIAALSFTTGAGVIVLTLFAVSLAGVTPNRITLASIAILSSLVLIVQIQRRQLVLPTLPARPQKVTAAGILGLLAIGLILMCVSSVTASSGWPAMRNIDVFAIWLFKVKWLMLKPLFPIPKEFLDPTLSYSHQDYPLGFPFLVAGLFAMLGRFDESLVQVLLLCIYLSLLAMTYASLRRLHPRLMSLSLTAVFAATPMLTSIAGDAVPESFLILCYLCTVFLTLQWMQTRERGSLLLAGVIAAALAFTKNEGLAFAAIVAALSLVNAACTSRMQRNMKVFIDWSIATLVSLLLLCPWLIYRSYLPRTHEDYGSKLTSVKTIFNNLSRLSYIFPECLRWISSAGFVGPIWYLLVLTMVLYLRRLRRPTVLFLLSLLLAQLFLYLGAFVVTPWDVHVLVPMVTPRLLTQASPVVILLIAELLRDSPPQSLPAGD